MPFEIIKLPKNKYKVINKITGKFMQNQQH